MTIQYLQLIVVFSHNPLEDSVTLVSADYQSDPLVPAESTTTQQELLVTTQYPKDPIRRIGGPVSAPLQSPVPSMSQIRISRFHGTDGEDVEEFIKQCRLAFAPQVPLYTDLEDREDAKVCVLTSNLAGAAAEYYQTWSNDDKNSWAAVTKKLSDRYGARSSSHRLMKAMKEFGELAQREMPMGEYVRKARRIPGCLGTGV